MSRDRDTGARLARAIEAAGPAVKVAARDALCWASVTFSGARHRLTLTATDSPELDRWLNALPDADFAIPGQLVADIEVGEMVRAGDKVAVVVEVLTVDD